MLFDHSPALSAALVASLLKHSSCFSSFVSLLQSVAQSQESLESFHFSFVYEAWTESVARSNYVNLIQPNSDIPCMKLKNYNFLLMSWFMLQPSEMSVSTVNLNLSMWKT